MFYSGTYVKSLIRKRMSRQLLHQITTQDLVPFFGQYEAYLTPKGSSILLSNTYKVGHGWLESCFLDQRAFVCTSGLVVEACAKVKTTSPATIFLVYIPANQTYFAFQLRHGLIYALVSRPNVKCQRYRQRENKYHLLTNNPSQPRHLEWKKQCGKRRFLGYAIYWLWREECNNHGWNIHDYAAFAAFRQDCKITENYQSTDVHSDYVRIKYRSGKLPGIRDSHGDQEVSFAYQKWLKLWNKDDFDEWKEFCQWKKNYYTQRCLHYENKPEVTWLQVAKCQDTARLTFILYPNQVIWQVDGYRVYAFTPLAPLHKIHVGLGIGSCGQSSNQCHVDVKEQNNDLCSFTSICLYLPLLPLRERCLTTETTSEDKRCEAPVWYPPPLQQPCYPPSSQQPCYSSQPSSQQPPSLNVTKESCDQKRPLEVTTHNIATDTDNSSGSTVVYYPHHPLSNGAMTSNLSCDKSSQCSTESSDEQCNGNVLQNIVSLTSI